MKKLLLMLTMIVGLTICGVCAEIPNLSAEHLTGLNTINVTVSEYFNMAAATVSHQATLNWTQSTTTGVTGNNVYRGVVSGGPYTQIDTSTSPITTYTDPNVTAGTTYYYVVTATCTSCNPTESGYSNQAIAVIPQNQPAAPTGLTVVTQ